MNTIAFVLKGYPRVSESFIAQEIFLLEQRGFNIEIWSMRQAREKERQPIVDLIQARVVYMPEYIWPHVVSVLGACLRLGLRRPRAFTLNAIKSIFSAIRRWDDDPLKRFLQASWLVMHARVLDRHEITHLHAHFVHAPTELTMYLSALTGRPYSISAHAKDIYTIPPSLVVERVNNSELIMTCTRHNETFLQNLPGIDVRKVHRIYHGVDLKRFAPTHPRQLDDTFIHSLNRFVSVGRLVRKKGYDLILQALADLKLDGIDFTYDIFGAGELAQELRELTLRYGLNERVQFHNVATHPQIIEFLDRGALFLSGSQQTEDLDRDGIPNTIAEAMAMEVPVIASRVSGIPELVIDGECGLLFRERDVNDLKEKIRLALAQPELMLRLARHGRERVQRVFDSEAWIQSCDQLLRPLAAGPKYAKHMEMK